MQFTERITMIIKNHEINPNRKEKTKDFRWLLYIWLVVGLLALLNYMLIAVNNWFEVNKFVFRRPVEVTLNRPISIEKREPMVILSPIVQETEEPILFDDLNEVEQLILDIFGLADFKVARAIAKAESGLNCEAYNVNTNRTIDYGVFQLNSIHWDRFGGLKNLVTCEQQVQSAYELYQEQGWTPWVVFNQGLFGRYINE